MSLTILSSYLPGHDHHLRHQRPGGRAFSAQAPGSDVGPIQACIIHLDVTLVQEDGRSPLPFSPCLPGFAGLCRISRSGYRLDTLQGCGSLPRGLHPTFSRQNLTLLDKCTGMRNSSP